MDTVTHKAKGLFSFVRTTARGFYARRRLFWASIAGVVIILIIVISGGKKGDGTETFVIAPQVLTKTVQATGVLTSDVDLSLGFERSGIVKTTPIAVGTHVKKGTILATLTSAGEQAEVTKARGSLLKAQAEYDEATQVTQNQSIANLELALANAEDEQDILVDNAYRTLLSDDLEAIPEDEDTSSVPPTVSGSYTCGKEGEYTIAMYASDASSGASFVVHGLEEGFVQNASTTSAVPLGACGLFLRFPEDVSSSADWIVEIPNTRSASYVTNLNAYNLALTTRDKTISELESELALTKAQIATGDTRVAYANLVSAQGVYDAAVALLEQTIIRAPSDGVVTKVTVSPGESVETQAEAVVLQDIDHLYVKANVNEANIIGITQGEKATLSFDALSLDHVFTGVVSDIDIAPTDVADVTNYTVTILVDILDPQLRPGMTANTTITLYEDADVITIPRRALIAQDAGWFVTLKQGDATSEVPVTIGRDGDGGLVEITNGLVAGDVIVIPV